MSNFIELCINGKALPCDIDDYIDQWHESDSKLDLNEYLGMTEEEYKYYIADEDFLPFIITAHRHKTDISSMAANRVDYEKSFAARSSDLKKAQGLIDYLRSKSQ